MPKRQLSFKRTELIQNSNRIILVLKSGVFSTVFITIKRENINSEYFQIGILTSFEPLIEWQESDDREFMEG